MEQESGLLDSIYGFLLQLNVEAYKLCKQGAHRIAEFWKLTLQVSSTKKLILFFLRNMDFWICFPSEQFGVGVEMGRGSKNITLCILCPSTQCWGRRGGTLGVFPIWENYAILQTQKYYLSHRKSHRGAGVGEFFSKEEEDICKFVFQNPCGRMDFFQMFLLDFTPSPRLFFLINGCQGRWAEAEFMHGRICRFLFPIWFVFVFSDLQICISILFKLSICVHTCICEFVFPVAPTSPRLRFPPYPRLIEAKSWIRS